MRKILAIPIIILILFSGVTVNLAFHYCGGQIADKKISLTEAHLSCGMEGDTQHENTGMSSLCCQDSVSSYTFNNTYLPSQSVKDDATYVELPVMEIFSVSVENLTSALLIPQAESPPGLYSPALVDLNSICVLRI